MARDLLTTAEAARELGIDRSRVLRLIQGGKLPARRFGPAWVIERDALELVRERRPGRPRREIPMTTAAARTITAGTILRLQGHRVQIITSGPSTAIAAPLWRYRCLEPDCQNPAHDGQLTSHRLFSAP